MAYEEGLAQIMRDDLAGKRSIAEKKMLGGLCFLHRGHMLCGVHKTKDKTEDLAMFRVGPDLYEAALALDGVGELTFTNRPMTGLVECDAGIYEDHRLRRTLMNITLEFTKSLPPK